MSRFEGAGVCVCRDCHNSMNKPHAFTIQQQNFILIFFLHIGPKHYVLS